MILLVAAAFWGCATVPQDSAAIRKDYEQAVRRIYIQAWQPADVVSTNASIQSICTVSVVIARDGSVISTKVVKPSGDEQMDKSVHAVLDKIRFVQPFENGARDKRRVFTINFVESELFAPMPNKIAAGNRHRAFQLDDL